MISLDQLQVTSQLQLSLQPASSRDTPSSFVLILADNVELGPANRQIKFAAKLQSTDCCLSYYGLGIWYIL